MSGSRGKDMRVCGFASSVPVCERCVWRVMAGVRRVSGLKGIR